MMQPLLTSLLGEAAELTRDYLDIPVGTRGVIRAVCRTGNPDREEIGGQLFCPYCPLQLESTELSTVAAVAGFPAGAGGVVPRRPPGQNPGF